MKLTIALALLFVPVSSARAAPAEKPCAKGCEMMRHHKGPPFDPKTVITLTGEVLELKRMEHDHGLVGVHVMLKADPEPLEAHLGPACFVDKLGLQIVKGQSVTVKGSKVKTMRGPALLTQEITLNGKTITLRDAEGRPEWGTCKSE